MVAVSESFEVADVVVVEGLIEDLSDCGEEVVEAADRWVLSLV